MTDAEMRRRGRFWLAWATTVVSLLFVYLAARDVDFDAFARALRGSDYRWLLPSLASLALTVFLRGLRWRFVFTPETRPPTAALMSALLVGYLFNNILPARAGEAARVVVLNQNASTSRAEALATVITERVYDVLTLLVLLFVAAPFLPDIVWLGPAAAFAVAIAVGLGVGIAVLTRHGERPLRFLLRPLLRLPGVTRARTEQAAQMLLQGFAAFLRPRLVAAPLALTVLSWLTLAVSFWLLTKAFDLGLGLGAGLLLVVATNLALLVPAAPAAVGVFEAATLVALAAYDVETSRALSFAIVLHVLNFLPFVVVGYIVLQRHTRMLRRRDRARLANAGPAARAGGVQGARQEDTG